MVLFYDTNVIFQIEKKYLKDSDEIRALKQKKQYWVYHIIPITQVLQFI